VILAARPITGAALRSHLREELLPLWDRHGWDGEHGGFHSRLSHDLRPAADGFKRLVVQMRQLYVYACIGAEGVGWARDRADAIFEHGVARFWDAKHGGWYLTTTPAGDPLDRSKDAYAHAFALLGLAYYHRLRPSTAALERALETLDLLERHLADPRHGGFQEGAYEDWTPRSAARRHNPHMHLFEALLALYEVTRDARFRQAAQRLMELFIEKLYPAPYGGLAETFEADWSIPSDRAATHAEPGHHFEWYWLVDRAAKLGIGTAPAELMEGLFGFAAHYGIDPDDGAVFDRISLDGAALDTHKRVWPQTEHAKALVVRYASGSDPGALDTLERQLALCQQRYVDPLHGAWREHVDRSGALVSDALNGTTLYHVFTAFEEAATALDAG